MLVSGEVDLAVQQIPELIAVEGVEVAGPLPGDLQRLFLQAGFPLLRGNRPPRKHF
jgi:hypothetical protein